MTMNDPFTSNQASGSVSDPNGSADGGTGADIKHQATEVLDQVQDRAGEVAQQVKQQAGSMLESQRERAAEGVGAVADVLRQTGQQFQQQNDFMARTSDEVGRRVEDLAIYLEQHSVNDILSDAERLARREPLLFLGGAFALGLLAARFFKSSGRNTQGSSAGISSGRNAYSSSGDYSAGRYSQSRYEADGSSSYEGSGGSYGSGTGYGSGSTGISGSSYGSGSTGTSGTGYGSGSTGTGGSSYASGSTGTSGTGGSSYESGSASASGTSGGYGFVSSANGDGAASGSTDGTS